MNENIIPIKTGDTVTDFTKDNADEATLNLLFNLWLQNRL